MAGKFLGGLNFGNRIPDILVSDPFPVAKSANVDESCIGRINKTDHTEGSERDRDREKSSDLLYSIFFS